MKSHLLAFLLFFSFHAKSQKVDSIYVNLYTDSLKKGTYNYINIDGKLANGRFIPLDTTDLILTASGGKFYGNSLWVGPEFNKEKIQIKAVLKSNPAMFKEFTLYIKKKPDGKLKSLDELINEPKLTSNKIPGKGY